MGSLLVAGHAAPTLQRLLECFGQVCADASSNVAGLDPERLSAREVVRYPAPAAFSAGTAALQVGKEIWLGAVRGDRIARYPVN